MFPAAPCKCIINKINNPHKQHSLLRTHPATMAKSDTKTPIIVASLVVVAVAISATLFVKKGGMESDGTYTCTFPNSITLALVCRSSLSDPFLYKYR